MKWGGTDFKCRVGHHWPRPWSVVRFTAAFLVSFIVTVFVPDSAVAARVCPIQSAYRGLQ